MLLGFGALLGYSSVPGGAVSDITKRFSTSAQENSQVDDSSLTPDPLYAEPSHEIPGSLNEIDHRLPIDTPLLGDPQKRSWATYNAVIDQFAVEENPRYQLRENDKMYETGVTYCNTFVWDVTRAMGAEIPYWLDVEGEPNELEFTEQGHWELWQPAFWVGANDANLWLNLRGAQHGWREVSAKKAQEFANLGHPTVASVTEADGFGHIGIVRPGEMLNGPALAQAGITNDNHAHVYDYFPREGTQFFVNDAGTMGDTS